MKISNIEVIRFRITTQTHPTKWGYARWGEEHETTQTVTKISTDDGVEGYMLGGEEGYIEGVVTPMIIGENPLEREKLWNWVRCRSSWVSSLRGPEFTAERNVVLSM